MKLPRRKFLQLVAGAAALPAMSRMASAQAYPARPVTIVVPFAAGGGTDVSTRIVGEYMARTLGQQFIIENVVGAGGTTGSLRAMRARPDGYTILMGHGASYKLNLSGLVDRRTPWTLQDLYQLPQESQVTRHVCVEGWSMIGKWTGVPFRTFLQRIGADLTAKYVGFECADGYYSSIDMASALHPQTFLTFKISDESLAPRYGYPLKLRIPTKLGFKNPKWITAIFVTNRFPGGFWEDRGYNWFAGV